MKNFHLKMEISEYGKVVASRINPQPPHHSCTLMYQGIPNYYKKGNYIWVR